VLFVPRSGHLSPSTQPLSLSNLAGPPCALNRYFDFLSIEASRSRKICQGSHTAHRTHRVLNTLAILRRHCGYALFLKGLSCIRLTPWPIGLALFGLLSATRDALSRYCSLSDRVSLFGLTDATRISILHFEPLYLKSFDCSETC